MKDNHEVKEKEYLHQIEKLNKAYQKIKSELTVINIYEFSGHLTNTIK